MERGEAEVAENFLAFDIVKAEVFSLL